MTQCRTLLGVQNFLRGVFRGAVYPKDIWNGDATYPRIFCTGVPKTGGDEYPMTPGWGQGEAVGNCIADNGRQRNTGNPIN